MAGSMYGAVWVSGLLKLILWIKWPMVVVGLWYGQAYVMDNIHRCILLTAFWMHRDTVTRYWGPLLCHSSTTITSCCSMNGVYDRVFQFLPISSNFAQPLKRSGPTFHRPQSTTWPTLCEGDVLHCVRQIVVTPDTDWFPDPSNTIKLFNYV